MDRRYCTGLLWALKWAVIVMLATLVCDCLYVMWPYPDGAVGLEAFRAHVEDEWVRLVQLCDERFAGVAYAIHRCLHTVLFQWTGLDELIVRAHGSEPLQGASEMMRRVVQATGTFWGTAAVGLQLFSARLAIVALSSPLIALASIGAAVDGLVVWYLRRTGGGRESGFIFHRAKRHGAHAMLAFCFVYLVPPQTVDPRIAVTALAVAVTLAVRVSVANFKKYL